MNQVRTLFAGGNTPLGFYSFYHQIIGSQANRLFILKGGPGTGKSTMMKWISAELQARGYDVEEFYCSSDVRSLDGVASPALQIAVVDGTAPHVMDPVYPGSFDEIVDLGNYWQETNLVKQREAIAALTTQKTRCFSRTYAILQSAKTIYDGMARMYGDLTDNKQADQVASMLIAEVFACAPPGGAPATIRHLFASAITPQGPVNFLSNLMDGVGRKYVIKGEPGTGKEKLLQRIVNHAQQTTVPAEVFHCPFDPPTIEHVWLPTLDTAVITSYPPHTYHAEGCTIVEFSDFLDRASYCAYKEQLDRDATLVNELMAEVYRELGKAKEIHAELEEYYVPHMDFGRVDQMGVSTLKKALRYG